MFFYIIKKMLYNKNNLYLNLGGSRGSYDYLICCLLNPTSYYFETLYLQLDFS